jgi:hypothetical protein
VGLLGLVVLLGLRMLVRRSGAGWAGRTSSRLIRPRCLIWLLLLGCFLRCPGWLGLLGWRLGMMSLLGLRMVARRSGAG